jgi:uncharacterized protein
MMLLVFGGALLIGLVLAANWVAARGRPALTQAFNRFLLLNHLGLILLGGGLLLLDWAGTTAVLFEEGADVGELLILGWMFAFMGAWGTAVTQPRARQWLYPITQVQPSSPVHTLALIFAGYLIANSVAAFAQGGLEGIADSAISASVWDVLLNQSLFLLLGLFGVGWLIRRNRGDLLTRLGLVWPTGRQMIIGTALIIVMIILQAFAGAIWLLLEPEQAELFGEMNNILLADFDSIGKWLLLALASGVGEEILFRGAIQPVFGLGFTSLLFAFAHVQYGLTPIFFLVFIMGIVLGLARQRYNTTIAIYIHCGYNFLLGLAALLAA